VKISAIFQTEYDGDATGPIWLVASETNRLWFEKQTDLDQSSALFHAEKYGANEIAIYHMILGIQEHYPSWDTIAVTGLILTRSISDILQEEGSIETNYDGFDLRRI